MEKKYQSTQIRIPENVFSKIQELSSESGASQNALMLILFQLGLKVYESKCEIKITDSV